VVKNCAPPPKVRSILVRKLILCSFLVRIIPRAEPQVLGRYNTRSFICAA
jgi:hypothetical protein